MSENGSGLGIRDVSVRSELAGFFRELSTALREERGISAAEELVQSLASPELRERLSLFLNNARKLPETSYPRLATAVNEDQIPSKLWLIEHLGQVIELQESHFIVIGGWFGILPLLLKCSYPSLRIRTHVVDIDPAACLVAETLLSGVVEDIAIECKNANQLDYRAIRRESHCTVVNTICEHMSDFVAWFNLLLPGQWLVLQSNNHWGCCEHVNCVASLEDFEAQASLSETHFRGTLDLANFRRFMLIGCR